MFYWKKNEFSHYVVLGSVGQILSDKTVLHENFMATTTTTLDAQICGPQRTWDVLDKKKKKQIKNKQIVCEFWASFI